MYMIIVTIKANGFKVEGHANYGKHGHDIVCSSVSTLVQTISRAMLEYTEVIDRVEEPGKAKLVIERNVATPILLDALSIGIKEIEELHPMHVRLYKESGLFE